MKKKFNPKAKHTGRFHSLPITIASRLTQRCGKPLGALVMMTLLICVACVGCHPERRFLTDDGHYIILRAQAQRWVHHVNCPRCEAYRESWSDD